MSEGRARTDVASDVSLSLTYVSGCDYIENRNFKTYVSGLDRRELMEFRIGFSTVTLYCDDSEWSLLDKRINFPRL